MNTPWIEIITILPCKNNCSYCPQNKIKEHYKGDLILTMDNFKKALSNVPTDVGVIFGAFSEAFGNSECADMMVYAHEQGYKIGVWTTMVGLTEKDAKKIENIPFIDFNVHEIGQPKRDFPFIRERHKAVVNSRAGNLFEVPRRDIVRGCNKGSGFFNNIMFPNGDVVLCCSDWSLQHILGNLFEVRYGDLKREKEYELCHFCSYAF